MTFLEIILFSLSLCADSFAVCLCSSVTLTEVKFKRLAAICLSFAFIHISFLFLGSTFGYLMLGWFEKLSKFIGLVLLVYVGGSMLLEGVRGEGDSRDLNGLRNVVLGGVATSIDALAAGVSLSTLSGGMSSAKLAVTLAVLFVVTVLSVAAGIMGGKAIGSRMGRWAEIAGGIVLIVIGVVILI